MRMHAPSPCTGTKRTPRSGPYRMRRMASTLCRPKCPPGRGAPSRYWARTSSGTPQPLSRTVSILLPEVPFEQDKFLARVDELQRVKSNVIIAASEGVKTADGTYLCDLVSTAGQLDAFGHKAILSGTSRYLSDLIHDKLNCKSRAIEFSTLQRCASHLASRTDVTEAYAVGGAAAAAAFAGETGKMIALKRVSEYPYQCITEAVDVRQVANLEKKVPLDWITPDGMQVTAAFEEYARPLILDEVTPVYVNGTPRHICL